MPPQKRLLVPGVEFDYGYNITQGILSYCRLNGRWQFYLVPRSSDVETFKRVRIAIDSWKADGIIFSIYGFQMERLIRRSGIPAVNVGIVHDTTLPTVHTDHAGMGKLAARYFLDNGFRNFGFAALISKSYSVQRCQGFVQELAAAGFDCDVLVDRLLDTPHENWTSSRRKMMRWLRKIKKPVAVFGVHDQYGNEMTQACEILGLRVPEEVAIVVATNSDHYCKICTPPLSSIDVDAHLIGYKAAALVDQLLGGAKPPSEPILVPPQQLTIRQSSDVIAMGDPDIAAAVRFIREHVGSPLSVKELLRQVPISRRKMEIGFLKFLGRTPKAEIMRVRLDRAKALLEATDLPIAAVARNSGFIEQRMFYDYFRHHVAMTPIGYRKNYRLSRHFVPANPAAMPYNPLPSRSI